MTNLTSHYAKRISLAILLVALSTSAVRAQFPIEPSNNMVGNWTVTNIEGYSIQLQIDGQNRFRMLVNGKPSEGNLETSGNMVTLKFTDGTQQKFARSFKDKQLVFEATTGNQQFVMDRAKVERATPRQTTGFPERRSSEMSTDEEVEQDVDESPRKQILGKWFAKMEDQQVQVFIKSEFRQDGTYTTSLLMVAGTEKETQKDTGRWTIENGKLISVSDGQTEREIAPIQFSNDNLIVDMTAEFGAKMVMSRSTEKVKPTQFDIHKLIKYAQGEARGGK